MPNVAFVEALKELFSRLQTLEQHEAAAHVVRTAHDGVNLTVMEGMDLENHLHTLEAKAT